VLGLIFPPANRAVPEEGVSAGKLAAARADACGAASTGAMTTLARIP
jgi:hypothetical protein